MGKQFESHFQGCKNTELFYHSWKCAEPKGEVLITHGLGEHSECYAEVAEKLVHANFNVFAWDLRGHGRSEGKRGYVEKFSDFEDDFLIFYEHLQKTNSLTTNKIVSFSHSMGGLITTSVLLKNPIKEISGVVLSSPGFGLGIAVPAWKEAFAKLGAEWFPKITLWNEILYENLTRDENKLKQYKIDPFRHDKVSPQIFVGMLNGFKFIEENESRFKFSLLLQMAGAEKIVGNDAILRFFDHVKSEKKFLHVYDDFNHEIYNEVGREAVYKDLFKFLNQLD